MVMIEDRQGIERYSLPQKIYDILMRVKEKITHEDQECWICFGGGTGTGKSLMSMRWMYIIFPDISNQYVCFDLKEFIDAILNAKKGTGVICDETISVLFSRQAMTKKGRLIAQLINQIRQKNLAIFLNIPNVLNLDWTAIDKLTAYVHVWESRIKRNDKLMTFKGNAAVYPELPGNKYRTKIIDYMKKKRSNPLYNFHRPRPFCTVMGDSIGETSRKPWYPVDEAEYRRKKEKILQKYREGKPIESREGQWMVQRDHAIRFMHKTVKLSERAIAKELGTTQFVVHDAIHREKQQKA